MDTLGRAASWLPKPLREMMIASPADPTARDWHPYDDTLVEMRKDARWSDALHKWETRVVMFDDAECERRAASGRVTTADRSI